MGPGFFLRIIPLAALGVLGTGLGLRSTPVFETPAWPAVSLAVSLACFIAARTFRDRAGWMAGFILGLSLAAGFFLGSVGWRASPASAVAAIVTLILAAVAGQILRGFFSALYTPLWVAAWVLLIGLIGMWLVAGAGEWTVPVAIVAGLVFAALSAAWFARLPPDPQPVSAMDLYLLGLNLFLTISLLQAEAVQP